jgi:hypothetical protein
MMKKILTLATILLSLSMMGAQAKSNGLPLTLTYTPTGDIQEGRTTTLTVVIIPTRDLVNLTLTFKEEENAQLLSNSKHVIENAIAGKAITLEIEVTPTLLPAYVSLTAEASNIKNRGFFKQLKIGEAQNEDVTQNTVNPTFGSQKTQTKSNVLIDTNNENVKVMRGR